MVIKREEICPDNYIRLSVTSEIYPHYRFSYLNLHTSAGCRPEAAWNLVLGYLMENRLQVLMALGFGRQHLTRLPEHEGLITFTELIHDTASGACIQLICTDSDNVTVREARQGISVKSVEHSGAEFYFVNNLVSDDTLDHYGQTYNAFLELRKIVEENNIGLEGLARTWLYADDILSWYDHLNLARTAFFHEEGVFNNIIPASTGVGLQNLTGSALLLNALLVKPSDGGRAVSMVDSPLQCSATDYKSSFSRAVEISLERSKRLMVSGTASIDGEGRTIHQGDLLMQIRHTMEVAEAIMTSMEYGWENVVRAIVYLKHPADADHFRNYCHRNNLDSSHIVVTGGTICRDNLLFEIELDAVRSVV